MGKCVLSAVGPPLSGPGLQVGPADHFLLYLHEKLARDDGLVGVLLQGKYFAPPYGRKARQNHYWSISKPRDRLFVTS